MALIGMIILLMMGWCWQCDCEQNIPCETSVDLVLVPCKAFITDVSKSPSNACCEGLYDIAAMIKTPGDRVDVCVCLKTAFTYLLDNYDPIRMLPLPVICRVNILLPLLTIHTDCDK
ncbi:hypothetical protein Dimus_025342 [Dionaea muscipula]